MRTKQEWLSEYSATHQNPVNKRLHTFCVPAILFTVLGALWHLQIPGIASLWWLNGATVFGIFALVFYARLGLGPFALMLGTLLGMFAAIAGLDFFVGLPMLAIYAVVFAVAWIGQFIGHYIEGKSPSFFEDLQFLLIGPLWVFYH